MNNKSYFIVLPLTLDGIPINSYGYDLSFYERYNVEVYELTESDFYKMDVESLNLRLFNKFGFLIGDGDYCFINYNDCEKIKEFLEAEKTCLAKKDCIIFYNKIIDYCKKAIELKTGIAFIY